MRSNEGEGQMLYLFFQHPFHSGAIVGLDCGCIDPQDKLLHLYAETDYHLSRRHKDNTRRTYRESRLVIQVASMEEEFNILA